MCIVQNEISQPKFLPLLHGVLSILNQSTTAKIFSHPSPLNLQTSLPLFLVSTYFPNLLLSPLQYYSEANEADSWMNEKAGLAASQDYGKDEDAATKYLKTHAVRVACSVNSRLHTSCVHMYIHMYAVRTYII